MTPHSDIKQQYIAYARVIFIQRGLKSADLLTLWFVTLVVVRLNNAFEYYFPVIYAVS